MKKVAAFTIVELVVALLISSLILSFAYYGYALMNRQLGKRFRESDQLNDYTLLQRALRRDITGATAIRDSVDGKSLILVMPQDVIRYEIDTVVITRTRNGLTDTFRLKGTIEGLARVSDSLPLIAGVRLEVMVNGAAVPFSIYKRYTGAELFAAENVLGTGE